ncbi:MAG: hypothetical protein ACJ8CR_21555, partial [Roseiflexaceae bacterium]
MSSEELEHKYKILKELNRRRRAREEQKARFGISVDPSVTTELEDITLQIAQVEEEIKTLSHNLQSVSDATVEIAQIESDGFFTPKGIRNIVSQSGLLPKG